MTVQEIRLRREKRIDNEGTPPLTFENTADYGVWGAGYPTVLDFTEEAKTKKYAPFDYATINNSSGEDLKVLINGSFNRSKLVRKGTIVTIKDFQGIRSFHIWKMSATNVVAKSEVEVAVSRKPLTDDEYRRRTYKRSFMQTVRDFIANSGG